MIAEAPCEMAIFFHYRTTKHFNPKKSITRPLKMRIYGLFNERMKIKSIIDRLIFLTFLTILPKSQPLFPIHTDGYNKRMCEWLPDSRSSLSKGR